MRSHKALAIKYFKSGWMFLDFMATFPFDLVVDGGIIPRLIRLLRLTKLVKLLDIGRIWHIEPDIPRVTTGEKNRVKKLKALGNSVCPQIPEIIGRLIMEVEREIQ